MYAETNRKIDEQDIERFEERFKKRVAAYQDDKRGASCLFFGCLGMMAVVAGILYFLFRADAQARSIIVWCFFIYGAIHGLSVLGELYKDKERDEKEAREIRAAIPTGYVVERHIVSSRCFTVESGQGHGYRKVYCLDIGDKGTLVTGGPMNSDETEMKYFDSKGRRFDSFVLRAGERLSPVASFSAENLRGIPGAGQITRLESYTVLSESFEELLQRLQAAYPLDSPDPS